MNLTFITPRPQQTYRLEKYKQEYRAWLQRYRLDPAHFTDGPSAPPFISVVELNSIHNAIYRELFDHQPTANNPQPL